MKYLLSIFLVLSIISSPALGSDQEDEGLQATQPAIIPTTGAEGLDDLDKDALYDTVCAVCRGVSYAFSGVKQMWDALNQEDDEVITADLYLAMLSELK